MLHRIPTGAVTALAASLGVAAPSALAQEPQPLMGEPLRGLGALELQLFEEGQTAFERPLTAAEGAGPIFNEVSCIACHNQPAVGGFGTRRVTRFGRAAQGGAPFDGLESLGGTLLQDQSFDVMCLETVPASADVTALRGTPILFGAGLLDAIPDFVIAQRALNQPPGLAGRAHMVQPLEDITGMARPGRLGWKGQLPSVLSFSIDATHNEMGLTSIFLPLENAPNGDPTLLANCDSVLDPEDAPDAAGYTFIDRVTHFQTYLAPPAQTPRSGMYGEEVFGAVGCADCHVREYTTSAAAEPALAGRHVQPYSDFLLHDVGALGDGIGDGQATETEMMTRPLWGLRQRAALLHDGRANSGSFADIVELAIAEHGGTALPSANAYAALTQSDKDEMLRFLASLGRAEFDWDTNNLLDEFDWFFLEPFLTGPAPAVPFGPDDDGALCDVDQDGDFDLVEFGKLQRVWTGN